MKERTEKTVNSLLYILNKLGGTGDFHKIFKILYFADQKHLVEYGTLISDDRYIRMDDGPVPSIAYDILKSLKGRGLLLDIKEWFTPYFEIMGNHTVRAIEQPDLDYFSESEKEAIDWSIADNRFLNFKALRDKSHDWAWETTNKDQGINIIKIAKAANASDEVINYVREQIEDNFAVFE
jgi:hypothetical protein